MCGGRVCVCVALLEGRSCLSRVRVALVTSVPLTAAIPWRLMTKSSLTKVPDCERVNEGGSVMSTGPLPSSWICIAHAPYGHT